MLYSAVPMSTSPHVLLLRGINVGGHHKVPMADLRALLTDLGYQRVRTYIQSGNVVLDGPGDDLVPRVQAALRDRLGFAVPVLTRTAADLAPLAAGHPLRVTGALDKHLYVAFLSGVPDPAAVAALDPDRSPPGRFLVAGREVFLHFPGGSAHSKLTADWLDRRLAVTSTWRNQATVRAIYELACG